MKAGIAFLACFVLVSFLLLGCVRTREDDCTQKKMDIEKTICLKRMAMELSSLDNNPAAAIAKCKEILDRREFYGITGEYALIGAGSCIRTIAGIRKDPQICNELSYVYSDTWGVLQDEIRECVANAQPEA